jgi:hypothetical protein
MLLRNVGWLWRTIWRHIPEYGTLRNHRCKTLKSYIFTSVRKAVSIGGGGTGSEPRPMALKLEVLHQRCLFAKSCLCAVRSYLGPAWSVPCGHSSMSLRTRTDGWLNCFVFPLPNGSTWLIRKLLNVVSTERFNCFVLPLINGSTWLIPKLLNVVSTERFNCFVLPLLRISPAKRFHVTDP